MTDERNNDVEAYHLQTLGKACRLPDGCKKRALLALTSWGMALFQLSVEYASTLDG
jgi:hypothetical protein